MPPHPPRSAFRRATFLFSRLLDVLVVLTVAILIIPVTLQIFARFTEFIPRYIWTEEAARFLLVWMIMLGAMVGVREGSHFIVDLFPSLSGKRKAALDLVTNAFMLLFGGIFLWYGIEFTEFAWFRISELAELPLWTIHIAWPLAGLSWLLFTGEHMWDSVRVLRGRD
jgi:TRAP-type C4-dicarboxylate transport system permease small subunit